MQNVYNIRRMKLPGIFKRKHSIANRLTKRVVLTMTIVFTFISACIFGIIWLVGSMFLTRLYQTVMEVSNQRINNIFSTVEVALTNNVPEVEENIFNGKKLLDPSILDTTKTNTVYIKI